MANLRDEEKLLLGNLNNFHLRKKFLIAGMRLLFISVLSSFDAQIKFEILNYIFPFIDFFLPC